MKRITYLLILALAISSCKKDQETTRVFEGNYTGSFRTIVNGKMVKSDFDVLLNANNFGVTKGDLKGSGSFKVINNNEVSFSDKNYWTANFDTNLLLNGNYIYETKGDSLILTKSYPAMPSALTIYNYYQYRLKRN